MNQFAIPNIDDADRLRGEQLDKLIEEHWRKVSEAQDQGLMALLKATMEETGLKASQLVLIQEQAPEAIRFYFRPKEIRA